MPTPRDLFSLGETVVTQRLGDRLFASADAVPGFGRDVPATLEWARERAADLGDDAGVAEAWSVLAATAARDVAAARILEPHLDARRVLAEAAATGRAVDLGAVGAGEESTWGVFAAEGAGARLVAEPTPHGWALRGVKPWCSLAAHLTHALITAWVGDDERALFAVDLRGPGVAARSGPWHARGLAQIVSAPVDFAGAPAVRVGEPGWYLRRPGFARGGMGVAACWWGAVVPLRDAVEAAAGRDGSDQIAAAHLGRADAALWAARAVLVDAARGVDGGASVDERVLALRVRSVVADAAEAVLREADHALGPLPLVADDAHARRVDDVRLYLRQHHADRDLARLGRALADAEARG